MRDTDATFQVADYAVFGVTVVISISIGVYYALSGNRQRTTTEYLVAGRSMSILPVAVSLIVSFESAIMMLGYPAEGYVYGIQYWIGTLAHLLIHLPVAVLSVSLFHPLQITSIYEYLELRYKSRAVRLVGSLMGILHGVFYMGIVLFGPTIALEAVTGFSQLSSILITACVAILYTSIGGLKAVIWTDVFQAAIMYSGMLAILIQGTIVVGSPKQVWEVAREGGRLNFFNFDFDPRVRHTFWNLFVGGVIKGTGFAFSQPTVQRISAMPSKRRAIAMMLIMTPGSFMALTLALYEGIVAYAFYETKGCDPLGSKKITNSNQVIPYTVMDIFQSLPGMPGLFLAALFSASFSTLSSGLSSISAMVWTDFVKPRAGHVSELTATLIAKIIVVVAGVISCGVALLVSLVGGPLNQISHSLLSVFSCTGLFLLACLCPWANAKGGIVGTVVAFILTGWIAFGQSFSKSVHKTPWLPPASMDKCLANHSLSLLNVTSFGLDIGSVPDVYHTTMNNADFVPEAHGIGHLYTLSYQWLGALNILTSVILGAFVSWCTGGNKKGAVDSRYLLPVCDIVCCCLPESIRRYFRCAECLPPDQTEETPTYSYPCNQEMKSRPEKDVSLRMPKSPEKNSTETDTEADLYKRKLESLS